MRVQEIVPDLWRWTALHPEWSSDEEWDEEVGCLYLEADDTVALIDPLIPPEDPESFLQTLDREVERAARPVHVFITIFWHARSAGALLKRYPGTRVWAHEPARELIEERAPVTDIFSVGETLPGGVIAVDAGRAYEVLYWLPQANAIVAGDVLLGSGEGGLTLCPEAWLGPRDPRAVRSGLREALLPLRIERVLPAHGEPILRNARVLLEAALAD